MIIRNVVLVVFLLFSINYMCQSQESRQLRFLSEIAATAGHIKLPHNQEKLAEVIEEFDEAMENLHDFMAGSDYPIAHKIFTLYNISFWQKLSKSCQTDFKDMLIYNQSIILFLDASSKVAPGFLSQLNLFWDGNYKSCLGIDVPRNQASPLKGKYCWVNRELGNRTNYYKPANDSYLNYLNQSLAKIGENSCSASDPSNPFASLRLKFAVCLPSGCDNSDSLMIMKIVSRHSSEQICDVRCQERNLDISGDANAIACIVVLVMLALLVSIGTVIDVMKLRTRSNKSYPDSTKIDVEETNGCQKFLLAFSAYSNGKKIFTLEKRSGQIDSIHGIRFFSMTWVVMGHSYMQLALSSDSYVTLGNLIKDFFDQIIVNATVSVDTFFLLSGLLVSYLFLKQMEKCQGRLLRSPSFWIKYYLHRYIRLTPPVALVMWTYVALQRYMANGPYWSQSPDPFCGKSWWTNLLYVNNIVYPDESCYGLVWYLANDMQFYIFAPLVLIPMFLLPIAGTLIAVGLILTSMSINAYLVASRHYPPSLAPGLVPADYYRNMYAAPWIRWSPYVLGLLLGALMIRVKKTPKMPNIVNLACWLLAATVALAILFGLFPYNNGWSVSTWESALYSATNRVLWSACVGWVIFACHYDYGGFVNSFLSWPFWFPFSRLSYSAYLVHWFILPFYFNLQERALHFDTHLQMMGSACAVVMLTYLVSIFVSLTMEAPILTLDQMLFGLFTPNKQKSATVGIGNKVATAQNEPDEKATLNERKINENISVTSMLYEDVIKSAEEAVHI